MFGAIWIGGVYGREADQGDRNQEGVGRIGDWDRADDVAGVCVAGGSGECIGVACCICGAEDVVTELSLSDWSELGGFGGSGIAGAGDGIGDGEFSGGKGGKGQSGGCIKI